MRIAVIGSGISGNLAARLLASEHDVELFEAHAECGGHTHTVGVEAFGRAYRVDTGFMVYNERNYPNFCRMLRALNIEGQSSDMSFSVCCERRGIEYQGSTLRGLFAQRRNLLRPAFFRMLAGIVRFNRQAKRALDSGQLDDGTTVGQLLTRCHSGRELVDRYLVPMAAAIWSARPDAILEFPARFLVGFFNNHGLLDLANRPAWQTIPGGAARYVERLLGPIRDRIRLSCPVRSVVRSPDGVLDRTDDGQPQFFDAVVFATHADQTLEILGDPSPREREILGAFPYQENTALLHTDIGQLPGRRAAWASWNYRIPQDRGAAATVTYDLSRLQGLETPLPLLLTLNPPAGAVDDAHVLRRLRFSHPLFTCRSIASQQRLPEISGFAGSAVGRTYFCGAYWGHGFHEDGVNSALDVAGRLLARSAQPNDDSWWNRLLTRPPRNARQAIRAVVPTP